MATAKWTALGTISSDISATTLNSLANGSTSAFCTYDNSSNLDLYALVLMEIASITSLTGAYAVLRLFPTMAAGASVPDNSGSVGGGDSYIEQMTVGASGKIVIFKVRLFPCSMRLCVTNGSGANFTSSANTLKVQTYNESVT